MAPSIPRKIFALVFFIPGTWFLVFLSVVTIRLLLGEKETPFVEKCLERILAALFLPIILPISFFIPKSKSDTMTIKSDK